GRIQELVGDKTGLCILQCRGGDRIGLVAAPAAMTYDIAGLGKADEHVLSFPPGGMYLYKSLDQEEDAFYPVAMPEKGLPFPDLKGLLPAGNDLLPFRDTMPA